MRTFGVRLPLHVTFLGEITEFPSVESASEGSCAVSTIEYPLGYASGKSLHTALLDIEISTSQKIAMSRFVYRIATN